MRNSTVAGVKECGHPDNKRYISIAEVLGMKREEVTEEKTSLAGIRHLSSTVKYQNKV